MTARACLGGMSPLMSFLASSAAPTCNCATDSVPPVIRRSYSAPTCLAARSSCASSGSENARRSALMGLLISSGLVERGLVQQIVEGLHVLVDLRREQFDRLGALGQVLHRGAQRRALGARGADVLRLQAHLLGQLRHAALHGLDQLRTGLAAADAHLPVLVAGDDGARPEVNGLVFAGRRGFVTQLRRLDAGAGRSGGARPHQPSRWRARPEPRWP